MAFLPFESREDTPLFLTPLAGKHILNIPTQAKEPRSAFGRCVCPDWPPELLPHGTGYMKRLLCEIEITNYKTNNQFKGPLNH